MVGSASACSGRILTALRNSRLAKSPRRESHRTGAGNARPAEVSFRLPGAKSAARCENHPRAQLFSREMMRSIAASKSGERLFKKTLIAVGLCDYLYIRATRRSARPSRLVSGWCRRRFSIVACQLI